MQLFRIRLRLSGSEKMLMLGGIVISIAAPTGRGNGSLIVNVYWSWTFISPTRVEIVTSLALSVYGVFTLYMIPLC